MKKYFTILFFFSVCFSCSSTEDLRKQNNCSIWKDQGSFGVREVPIVRDTVSLKTKCLFLIWLCSSYEFRVGEDNKIYGKGPGLFNSESVMASLNGDQVTYEPSIFERFAKSSPITLDLNTKKAYRTVEMKIIQGPKDTQELEFNNSCTQRQAAVGAVALWATENLD